MARAKRRWHWIRIDFQQWRSVKAGDDEDNGKSQKEEPWKGGKESRHCLWRTRSSWVLIEVVDVVRFDNVDFTSKADLQFWTGGSSQFGIHNSIVTTKSNFEKCRIAADLLVVTQMMSV